MAAASHPHGRVGARHRAKLKKWSDKIAREEDGRANAASAKRQPTNRKQPLEAARKRLRKLFH